MGCTANGEVVQLGNVNSLESMQTFGPCVTLHDSDNDSRYEVQTSQAQFQVQFAIISQVDMAFTTAAVVFGIVYSFGHLHDDGKPTSSLFRFFK